MEVLNVILTTQPFLSEYPDSITNYGYGSVTNEMRVVVECLDFDVSSMLTNNIYYLENELDDYMPDAEIDAHTFCELIDMHQYDRGYENFNVSSEDYEHLYSYLAKMYIKKYVTSDMNYDQVMQIQDRLVETLSWGVPDLNQIRLDVVYDVFSEYCLSNGLSYS